MFLVTFVLHEQAGVDRSEALRPWRETHAPLVADVAGFADAERLPTAFVDEVVVVG